MRLPYIQVAQEAFEYAKVLGGLLGISRREALGLLNELWAWSLKLGPKDGPPTGELHSPRAAAILAAALEWPAERAEALVDALEAPGVEVVQRLPDGLRVKGTDRYATAWESAGARSEKARKAAGARWGKRPAGASDAPSNAPSIPQACAEHAPSTAQAMLGDAKTQTQTQTHEETASQAAEPAAPAAPVLELKAQDAGKRPRAPSKAERLFERIEARRREACEAAGVPFVAEGWHPSRQNKQLGPVANAPPEEQRRFEVALDAYLDAPENATREPPFSLGFFLASRATWESRALKAAGGAR